MADNYLQFCTEITDLSRDEKIWLERTLNDLDTLVEYGPEDEDYPRITQRLGPLWDVWCKEFDPLEYLGFQYTYDTSSVTFYSDEGGEPYAVALVIREFLRTHRPDAHHIFSWAYTCSRPRVDQFDGGAAVITAKEIRMHDASQWAREELKRMTK